MLVRNSDSMPPTWPTESEPLVGPRNLILTSTRLILKHNKAWDSLTFKVEFSSHLAFPEKASQVWPCLPLLSHSIHPGLLVAPSSFAPLLMWSLILDLPHLSGKKSNSLVASPIKPFPPCHAYPQSWTESITPSTGELVSRHLTSCFH